MILKKFSAKKIGVLFKQSQVMQKLDHSIGFYRKAPIFSPKIVDKRRKLRS
jgi:hypothetical protein